MINYKKIISLFLGVCIISIVKSQSINWIEFSKSIDSAVFENKINPKNYAVASYSLLQIEKWKNDDNVQGDSLFDLLSNWNVYPTSKQTGIICKYFIRLDTNYSVPYFVYIPKNYNKKYKTILLVYYKGGWMNSPTFQKDYYKEILSDNPTFQYLDKYNVIEIFPALKNDLAIYGRYGYQHLQKMIVDVKKRFNIDDNKVFLSGFSDGAKTVYNVSYLAQTTFACFYAINGYFPSSSIYFPNYFNRPIVSFSATKDEISDYRSIKTKAEYVNKSGGNWAYRELPNKTHFYFSYADEILPIIFEHLNVTSRNPLPVRLAYDRGFNDDKDFTGIDWLQMHVNTNVKPTTYAFTDSIRTLSAQGEKNNYLYGENTGQIRAQYSNNTFTITASQVDSITIYISPLMVDMNVPIKIIVNEKELYNQKISYSKDFMINRFFENFDRAQIFVNKIEVKIDN